MSGRGLARQAPNPDAVGDESLLDDMRAAVRGDFERARQRRDTGPSAEPAPVTCEIHARLPRPDPEPVAEQSEPQALPPPGLLSRLFRRD